MELNDIQGLLVRGHGNMLGAACREMGLFSKMGQRRRSVATVFMCSLFPRSATPLQRARYGKSEYTNTKYRERGWLGNR